MIAAYYLKNHIRIADVWFSDGFETKGIKADIIRYYGIEEKNCPQSTKGLLIKSQNTLITDLTESQEELKKRIKSKGFKGDIKKSYSDDISIQYFRSNEIDNKAIANLTSLYNKMFASKNMSTTLNYEKIKGYIVQNALVMSVACYQNEPIVFHVYVVDTNNVRFLYSCSNFREEDEIAKLIGRANKRLHWEDWMYFKECNIKRYDWGGVVDFSGTNSIDQFKMHFGGCPKTYYHITIPVTIIGKLAMFITDRK